MSVALSRWPRFADRKQLLVLIAILLGSTAILWHAWQLWSGLRHDTGLVISLGNALSFVGLQLALVGAICAGETSLRGLSGGLLILAGVAAAFTGLGSEAATLLHMGWQIQAHILISLFAYGLLSVGAIVAVYALVQDRRLRRARLSSLNQLFAPLETMENLLFGITTTGFLILLLAIFSGLAFVENLFAQHLVHKTVLSIISLLLFGVLLIGRHFAGWRGRRAFHLYLWGFVVLALAYFGSRFILEALLGRTWG